MATRAQKVKLGLFVLVGGGLAAAMLVVFAQLWLFEDRVRYYVRAPSVEGLDEGATVAVRGVPVGSVEEITLFASDYDSVTITLSVAEGTRINADDAAYIEFEGLTGRRTVNLYGGTGEGGALAPESYIPHERTLIDELPRRADRLLAQASNLLETTNAMVERLDAGLAEVDLGRIDGILERSEALAASATRTSDDLGRLARDMRGPMADTMSAAGETFARLDQLAARTDETAVSLERAIAQLSNVVRKNDADLTATLRNLRRASASFDTLARELRMKPGLLLFGEAPPERELP